MEFEYRPLDNKTALNNRIQFSIKILMERDLYPDNTVSFYEELIRKDVENLISINKSLRQ